MNQVRSTFLSLAATAALVAAPAAHAQTGSAVGGTGGSAAAGGTSASSLGLGGTTRTPTGSSSALATGSSAAAASGKTQSRTHIVDNKNKLMGQSRAQAHDGGTFSKSRTKTDVQTGESVTSTTRSMSHVPGSAPTKSTTTITNAIPQ